MKTRYILAFLFLFSAFSVHSQTILSYNVLTEGCDTISLEFTVSFPVGSADDCPDRAVTLALTNSEGVAEFRINYDLTDFTGEGCVRIDTVNYHFFDEMHLVILSVYDQPELGPDNYVTSVSFAFCPLSVEENALTNITVYPNPVADHFTLQNTGKISNAVIYDINGRAIASYGNVPPDFDVSALSPGLYMLNAETDRGPVSTRFMKL